MWECVRLVSSDVVLCVTGQTGEVWGFYQYLVLFTAFCQHVEAGNDCFPASAQVAAVLETCFYMRWHVGSSTALPASLNSIFV